MGAVQLSCVQCGTWKTYVDSVTDLQCFVLQNPEAGEVSPPVGAGRPTATAGPLNMDQATQTTWSWWVARQIWLIPGSPKSFHRQEPTNSQIDKSDLLTFAKRRRPRKRSYKKKKGNKTRRKEKGNSTIRQWPVRSSNGNKPLSQFLNNGRPLPCSNSLLLSPAVHTDPLL